MTAWRPDAHTRRKACRSTAGRSPWHIVRTDDKRRGRLNLVAQLLKLIPYEQLKHGKVKLPERSKKNAYDDAESLKGRRFVREVF